MQISAANLLIASQQAQKSAPQPNSQAAFASALQTEGSVEGKDAFAPIAFRKAEAAPGAPQSAATEPQPAPAYGQPARPGQTIDIRV